MEWMALEFVGLVLLHGNFLWNILGLS